MNVNTIYGRFNVIFRFSQHVVYIKLIKAQHNV